MRKRKSIVKVPVPANGAPTNRPLENVRAYGFDFAKVMKHCKQIPAFKDQLFYLMQVDMVHMGKKLYVDKTPNGYRTTEEAWEFHTNLRAEVERRRHLLKSAEDKEDGETFTKVKNGELKIHPIFEFDYERIMSYLSRFDTLNERLIYLNYVKKELSNLLAESDFYDKVPVVFTPDLVKTQLENEIEFLRSQVELSLSKGSTHGKPKGDSADKIQWTGSEAQLVYLFELLFQSQFIARAQWEKSFRTIADHFVNKKGEALDNKQLAQTAQNIQGNKNKEPKGANGLQQIVRQVKDRE
jgi:hypothetical protein